MQLLTLKIHRRDRKIWNNFIHKIFLTVEKFFENLFGATLQAVKMDLIYTFRILNKMVAYQKFSAENPLIVNLFLLAHELVSPRFFATY